MPGTDAAIIDAKPYPLNEAAAILFRSRRQLYRLIEAGKVATTTDGRVLGITLRKFLGPDAVLLAKGESPAARKRRGAEARKRIKELV